MTMEIGGVGGASSRIDDVVRDLGQTTAIVRDIFTELDEFKQTIDKDMREASARRIQEDLERLHQMVGNMGGRVSQSLANMINDVQSGVDSARISGSNSGDAESLNHIQQVLDQLRDQLGSTPV